MSNSGESTQVKIAIATCAWRRPYLTRAMLRYYKRAADSLLRDGIALSVSVAGSEGEQSRHLCDDTGFFYTEAPNRPLGGKWNSAVKLLREHDPDAILVVGSDDWLSHGLLRGYANLLREGRDYVALTEVYLLDANTRRCLLFRGLTGVARMIQRGIMERLGWQLWPDALNRSLDHGMRHRFQASGIKPLRPWSGSLAQVARDAIAVDIKTSTNLWSFHRLARHRRKVTSRSCPDVLRHFSNIDRDELEAAMCLECGRK